MADQTQTPPIEPQAPQTVNAFNRYGEPEQIPQGNLNEYLQAGYRVATPEEVQDVKGEAQYGTGAGTAIKAGLAGAARGLTFGGSDVALTESGAVAPETLAGLQKYRPGWSGAGEAGGVIGGIAFAPEAEIAGVARTALEAAQATGDAAKIAAAKIAMKAAKEVVPELSQASLLNPVGALSTVSRIVAEKATPEASSFVGQILSKAAGQALGSGIEGSAYGLGHSVSESALGDPDAMGEKLVSNIGWSALLGGGLGGLIGAGEVAIPGSLQAAKDAIVGVKDAADGTSQATVGPLGKAYAKAASFISGKPEEDIMSALKQRAMSASPEEIHNITSGFHDSLNDLHTKVSSLLKDANKDLRPEETDALLAHIDPKAAQEVWLKQSTAIEGIKNEMKAEPHLYSEYYPRTLEKISDGFNKEVNADSSSADIFNALNKVKSRLDDEIKYGRELDPKVEKAQGAFRALRRSIKDTLQDEGIWGEAGARQAAFNDAQSAFLQATGKGGLFQKNFMGKYLTKGGSVAYRVDPGKIQTFLSRLNSVSGEEKAKILSNYIDTANNVVGQVGKTYESLPSRTFDSGAVQDLVGKARTSATAAEKQIQHQKLMNSLGGGGHNVPLAEGFAMFTALHNPALAAGIEGFNLAKNPALAIQRLSKIERSAQSVTRAIGKGASFVFNKGTNISKDLAGYAGSKLATEDDFNKRVKQIQSYSGDTEHMMDAMTKGTQSLNAVAPNITQGVHTATSRAVQFLNSKIPVNPPPKPFDKPLPINKSDRDVFNTYYNTIEHPTGVFGSIKDGTLVPQQVEAIKTVMPKMYQEMTSQITEQLMKSKAKDEQIPYHTKMALSLFLGQDLDDSLEQPLIAQNQMAMQIAQAQEDQKNAVKTTQGGLGKITKSTQLLTPMQATAQREA